MSETQTQVAGDDDRDARIGRILNEFLDRRAPDDRAPGAGGNARESQLSPGPCSAPLLPCNAPR